MWAVTKSRALARRRLELEAGAPRASGTTLAVALKRYFDAHPTLRPRTRQIYRQAADKLEVWAEKAHVRSADDLDRPRLLTFREALVREPKRAVVTGAGVGRGKRAPTTQPRSAAAVNQELRSIRTVLGYVRDLDLLPKLSHDDLRRALKRLPLTHERVEFLKPRECQSLLEAALRHDAERYDETREEHAGLRLAGTTARYHPIAPFTAFVLLSGMRFGEAVELDWKDVDLEALDHDGKAVGEIHLGGTATKTKHPRTVGLEVSPGMRRMLAAMRMASGGEAPCSRYPALRSRLRPTA